MMIHEWGGFEAFGRMVCGRMRQWRRPFGELATTLFPDAEAAEYQVEYFLRVDVAFETPDRIKCGPEFGGDDLRRGDSGLVGGVSKDRFDGIKGIEGTGDGRRLKLSPPAARQSIAASRQIVQFLAQATSQIVEAGGGSPGPETDSGNI